MTTQIAIRLDEEALAVLDAEVAAGRATSRSDAVRRGIAHLRRDLRFHAEDELLVDLARRGEQPYPDLVGLAGQQFVTPD